MWASLVQLLSQAWATECAITETYYESYSKWNIKITSDGTLLEKIGDIEEKKNIPTGTKLTMACTREGEVFVNSVRNTKGVNVTHIDEDSTGIITAECNNIVMTPDFFGTIQQRTMAAGYRHIYCQPGCDRVVEFSHTVTYPPGTLTKESHSPPVSYSKKEVRLGCKEGFVRANGDVGVTTLTCDMATKGWSTPMSGRMKCLRGCQDIRESVRSGTTEIKPNTKDGVPPFQTGDILSFSCNDGSAITGYSTVTCNSLNKWSSDMPQCVADRDTCRRLGTHAADKEHML